MATQNTSSTTPSYSASASIPQPLSSTFTPVPPPVPSSNALSFIVMDNGSDKVKIGFGGQEHPLRIVTNSAAKSSNGDFVIADQIDALTDRRGIVYRRPHENGIIVDSALQSAIWSRLFGPSVLDIKELKGCNFLMTEAPFTPTAIRKQIDEIVFEKYEFSSFHRSSGASWALRGFQFGTQTIYNYRYGASAALIVDCGYSATHFVPLINYQPCVSGIRRLNIGGKHVSNYLKELITRRQLNLMNENSIVSDVKEKLCFVAVDFNSQLRKCQMYRKFPDHRDFLKYGLVKEYVLPNYTTRHEGVVRMMPAEEKERAAEAVSQGKPPLLQQSQFGPDDQSITLSNERILAPEILFNPIDAGVPQGGIAQGIVESVYGCHPSLHAELFSHIIAVGGSALFPNFIDRLREDLRALVPDEYSIDIQRTKDPITTTWCGGSVLAVDPNLPTVTVSRAEYQEYGNQIMIKKFSGP